MVRIIIIITQTFVPQLHPSSWFPFRNAGLDKASTENDVINKGVKKIGREIIGKLVAKVGWDAREEDGHLDKLLRGTMVRLLSVFCYDDEGAKKEAECR